MKHESLSVKSSSSTSATTKQPALSVANTGRSSDVVRPPTCTAIQTTVAISTSAISSSSSATLGKRKSFEKNGHQPKKHEPDKGFNENRKQKASSTVKPLVDSGVPKRTGAM